MREWDYTHFLVFVAVFLAGSWLKCQLELRTLTFQQFMITLCRGKLGLELTQKSGKLQQHQQESSGTA